MFQVTVDKLTSQEKAASNCIYGNFEAISKYIKINEYFFKYIYEKSEIPNKTIYLNGEQRKLLSVCLGNIINIYFDNTTVNFLETASFDVIHIIPKNKVLEMDDDEINYIKQHLYDIPIGGSYNVKNSKGFIYKLSSASISDKIEVINASTEIIINGNNNNVVFTNKQNTEIFKNKFNFNEMDIGGLDKEFLILFRRAFSSRLMPQKIKEELGIKDIKGIMLYGPPGNGKSLIARKLSQIINAKSLQIVTGPSLLDKYVGGSEQNVRKLFEQAEADYKSNNKTNEIHVIICDECDSIFKKRGNGQSTGENVTDNVVNQFLSKIDGPESLPNILLICMTNNLHVIDPAIIRPGRVELLLEIKLPDSKGRYEIFDIHLRKINNSHKEQLNLNEFVNLSENFTGAEIEGVVENAKSYAMARVIDPENLKEKCDYEKIIITQEDVVKSLNEITPAFGTKSKIISIISSKAFSLENEEYNNVYENICNLNYEMGKVNSVMIKGKNYSGKTTMACHIAQYIESSCIKFINAESLIGSKKDSMLYEIISDCSKSTKSTIILDSIEKIIEFSSYNRFYNNSILQIIYILLDKVIEQDRKINVIMTSSNPTLMENLGFNDLIKNQYTVNEY